MTNYTVTANPVTHSFGSSSAIRSEFTLIATAITSKSDKAGQVYTGTHDFTGAVYVVATQAPGDNTTKAASTAFVHAERTNAATLTNKTLTTPVINSPTGLVKADVGLSSVDNTTDLSKPISTATQSALNLKANIASPTFTGVVTIPSGASIDGFAPLASPTFTGSPSAPTPSSGTNDTSISTTAFVSNAVATQLGGVAPVVAWVSDTTYSIGNNVFSPIDFYTYRRKTAGAGTTDPSLDRDNWLNTSAVTDPGTFIYSATNFGGF